MKKWLFAWMMGLGVSTAAISAHDIETKVELERAAVKANAGDIEMQVMLCNHYGDWLKKPPTEYSEWCEAAVSAGDSSAMTSYASRLESGIGVLKNLSHAIEIYSKAAEKGNPWAHARLGFYRGAGIGLPKDDEKSCKHYQAAAKEISVAQEGLAVCYDDGVPGFPKDIKKAIELYEQSASDQYLAEYAHYRLGYLYFFGTGVERNPRIASKWLLKSINRKYGYPLKESYYILALMYEDGDGMVKNDALAFKSYLKAADSGHSPSQNKLGVKYAEGKGIAKDMTKSLMWFTIAAANGYKDAVENRDKAEKMLKPQEINLAQKLANDWLSKHPFQ